MDRVELIEAIKEELVMLSLLKNTETRETEAKFTVVCNYRSLFQIQFRNSGEFVTYYKGKNIPALQTKRIQLVFDQVKQWIEKETMKD